MVQHQPLLFRRHRQCLGHILLLWLLSQDRPLQRELQLDGGSGLRFGRRQPAHLLGRLQQRHRRRLLPACNELDKLLPLFARQQQIDYHDLGLFHLWKHKDCRLAGVHDGREKPERLIQLPDGKHLLRNPHRGLCHGRRLLKHIPCTADDSHIIHNDTDNRQPLRRYDDSQTHSLQMVQHQPLLFRRHRQCLSFIIFILQLHHYCSAKLFLHGQG